MAGGKFIKTVSKDRPGTYTNFEDIDPSLATAGGAGSGGGGGGGNIKPDDYLIGKIVAMTVGCPSSNTIKDFVAAAEDIYCGATIFN